MIAGGAGEAERVVRLVGVIVVGLHVAVQVGGRQDAQVRLAGLRPRRERVQQHEPAERPSRCRGSGGGRGSSGRASAAPPDARDGGDDRTARAERRGADVAGFASGGLISRANRPREGGDDRAGEHAGGGRLRRRRCATAAAALRALFEPTPLQRNDYLSATLRRRGLAEARGPDARSAPTRSAAPSTPCARRSARAPRPPALRLRLGRQPRPGHGLRLPPLRRRGRRLHAGDDAAAEDRQDPASSAAASVEIRLVGDYFDATLAAAQAFAAEAGALLPAAVRRRRRDRGPGDRSRSRSSSSCRRRPISSWSRSAAAGSRPGSCRCRGAGARTRGPPRRAGGRAEPPARARGRRARHAAARSTTSSTARRWRGSATCNFAALAALRRRTTCCSRRRTASARRWSRC